MASQDRLDVLILGSGGAGLFAALHAHQHAPDLSITVAVKGTEAEAALDAISNLVANRFGEEE
mgnify:CR=1 FL=1